METQQLELARKIIESTGCSLFLTGKAGTGKTTFLRNLRTTSRKRMVVTAPTGIAAINAGGMTLHSFFQLDFGPFIPGVQKKDRRSMAFSKEKIRMIRGLDLLVIDEVSMVRADVLDAVDDVLRRFRDRTQPFGGVQLLLIGDLQQLPPVVVESERGLMSANYRSPYFFDSHALSQLDYVTIELSKVFRQSDERFIDLLNAVRNNCADARVLEALNRRHIPGFNPDDKEGYVRLTTHNAAAARINEDRLAKLPGEAHIYKATVQGNFPESSYPAEFELPLKVGAQVMFIKNDTGFDRQFYNGMMGKVTAIDEDGTLEVTPDETDNPIKVEPMQWENVKFGVDDETKEITQNVDGTFTQIPLKAAWAITIHKSQGLTFDRAIIDTSAAFSHGQTYVALSRCRSLEGMVLETPLTQRAIITDPTVTSFMSSHTANTPDEQGVQSMVDAYAVHLAGEMFNFRPIFNALEGIQRLYNEDFMRLYPQQVQDFIYKSNQIRDNLLKVGDTFRRQLATLYQHGGPLEENDNIRQRIKDASQYFLAELEKLLKLCDDLPIEHDNKKVLQKLVERFDLFESMTDIRKGLLETFCDEDFNVNRYLDMKAAAAFKNKAKKKRKERKETTTARTEDNVHPALFDMLNKWRRERAEQEKVPAYVVATTKTLLAISNHVPQDYDTLLRMPGIGQATLKKYGDDILDIVDKFVATTDSLTLVPLPPQKKKRRH